MNKLITIMIMMIMPMMAQDITNKLGSDDATATYDITDSNDNVLFRVEGNGKIGIGTNTPDANLDVHGTVKAYGNWDDTSYIVEKVYQATTDGLVSARITSRDDVVFAIVIGYTDSNSNPSIIRAVNAVPLLVGETAVVSILMPVKNGEYWKVGDGSDGYYTSSAIINFIPLGQ